MNPTNLRGCEGYCWRVILELIKCSVVNLCVSQKPCYTPSFHAHSIHEHNFKFFPSYCFPYNPICTKRINASRMTAGRKLQNSRDSFTASLLGGIRFRCPRTSWFPCHLDSLQHLVTRPVHQVYSHKWIHVSWCTAPAFCEFQYRISKHQATLLAEWSSFSETRTIHLITLAIQPLTNLKKKVLQAAPIFDHSDFCGCSAGLVRKPEAESGGFIVDDSSISITISKKTSSHLKHLKAMFFPLSQKLDIINLMYIYICI